MASRQGLVSSANYFRATFAWNGVSNGPENRELSALFLDHPAFVRAATQVFPGKKVVVPTVVYANVFVPGQELGVHTDGLLLPYACMLRCSSCCCLLPTWSDMLVCLACLV